MAKKKTVTEKPEVSQSENGFWILRDTREQLGWEFSKRLPVFGSKLATLKTGDYSIEGLEERFVIERKRNTAEIANNLTSDWERFERELERLESFEFPFLICEFTLADLLDYPRNSGVPASKWRRLRVRGEFLLKRILEIETTYKTRVMFAGTKGKELARSLCKRIYEKCNG